MTTITLCNFGDSVVMTLPKEILKNMKLQAGSEVSLIAKNGKLIVQPKTKPNYSLAELMAKCDLTQPLDNEERQWLDDINTGMEQI